MGRSTGVAFLIPGIFYSIIFTTWAIMERSMVTFSFLGATIGLSLPMIAKGIEELKATNDQTNVSAMSRNRITATGWSFIPGLGHIYLGKKIIGTVMFGALIFSIIAFSAPTILKIGDPHIDETTDAILVYGGITFISLLMWSIIEVAILCNEMGLPRHEKQKSVEYNTEMFNIDFRHPHAYLSICLIVSFLCIIGVTYFFLKGPDMSVNQNLCIAAVVLSFIFLIRSVVAMREHYVTR